MWGDGLEASGHFGGVGGFEEEVSGEDFGGD